MRRPARISHQAAALVAALTAFFVFFELTKKETPYSSIASAGSPGALLRAEQSRKELRHALGLTRPEAPDEFLRYHADIRTREGTTEPGYPANHRIQELSKAMERYAASLRKSPQLPWIERGPGNVGGRTRGLIVDPDDPTFNTWFAGSVGGGIWKTTTGGLTWENKTPTLPNLATTTLAMASSNRSIIYAGTGEGFGNIDAIRGDGIWKSTNRGESWQQLASTARNTNFFYVNRLLVDPTDERLVLAATNTGIFRSTDGGMSWANVYGSASRVQHLIAHPNNFSIQFATQNGFGVLKSTDRGINWTRSSQGLGGGARYELAIAPSDPNRIYVAVETNSSTSDLYLSDDAGASWIKTSQSTSLNWLGGQGWYNNTIAVHPYEKDIVFVGGLDLYKITIGSGGSSSSQITSVDTINTGTFLSFVNFGLPFMGGGVGTGVDFVPSPISLTTSDYVSVEIRFGGGRKQKAHRFVVPDGAGQPVSAYSYGGYVDVPFEVWDVTNQRQLMVSFRDQINNGVFDLSPNPSGGVSREYLFVNAVPYDPTLPHPNIALAGGMKYKNIYGIGPALASGSSWNPQALPEAILRINYGTVITRTRTSQKISDWRLTSQTLLSQVYVHADHHNIYIVPTNPLLKAFRIINANDGGIAISTDGGVTWRETTAGYITSQFYGATKKPAENVYIGGMQDNGTWMSGLNPSAQSEWRPQLGGDGFAVAWHPTNLNYILGSIQYNNFRRTTNGGATWIVGTTDITDVGSGFGPFVSVLASSPLDPDLVFAVGSRGVWRSDNFAENWTSIPITTDWGFGTGATAAISLADPQIVWAGVRMSSTGTTQGRLWVSRDGGITFQPTTNYTSATLGRLSGLATHPTEPHTAYALFSFARAPKILRTTDLGQSWTDISGFGGGSVSTNGFPDVATYALLVLPHRPNEIWVGTEIGLFISIDNGQSWSYSNNGLPAASIWQLKVVDDQVVAATHGRGVWSVTLPELASVTPRTVTLAPRLNKSQQTARNYFPINLSLRSAYDSTQVLVDRNLYTTLPANGTPMDLVVHFRENVNRPITVELLAYKQGVGYRSSSRTFSVIVSADKEPLTPTSFSLEQNYPNPFNSSTTIRFALPRTSRVQLVMYDLRGREVASLLDQELPAGVYAHTWDARGVASGAYVCRLTATDPLSPARLFSDARRLILLK
jgi:photosystem II stability/assembly factor-like uncharacterized protein